MKKISALAAAVFAAGALTVSSAAAQPIETAYPCVSAASMTISDAAYYSEDYDYYTYEEQDDYYAEQDDSSAQKADESQKSFTAQDILGMAGISLVIGLIVAAIVCLIMKSFMKTANSKRTASDYIRKNSFNITRSRDIFIYANVTKKKRVKEDEKRR